MNLLRENENPDILEELLLNTYVRTSRWDKANKTDDPLIDGKEIDPVARTLFNTTLQALDLYNKPMARNVQLLNEHIQLLLDGPRAGKKEIEHAARLCWQEGFSVTAFIFHPCRPEGMKSSGTGRLCMCRYSHGKTHRYSLTCSTDTSPHMIRQGLIRQILLNYGQG